MPQMPPKDPMARLLIGALIASLAERAESGEREGGPVNAADLITCPHKHRLFEVEGKLEAVALELKDTHRRLEEAVDARVAQAEKHAQLVDKYEAQQRTLEQIRALVRLRNEGRDVLGYNGFMEQLTAFLAPTLIANPSFTQEDRGWHAATATEAQVAREGETHMRLRVQGRRLGEQLNLVNTEGLGMPTYDANGAYRGVPPCPTSPASNAAATCGGEAIAEVHAFAVAEEREMGRERAVGAGIYNHDAAPAPSEMATLHQVVDELGAHASAMCTRLNERLPRGFFAHITIAKKD